MDVKQLKNTSSMLIDLLNGDPSIFHREDYKMLNMNEIKLAFNYLKSRPEITQQDKMFLASNAWRVNYKDKPPTPANFISEKYLGPVALYTYPRVKKTFEEFLNPMMPYRNAILYPHIGFGKSYLSGLITIYIGVHLSMMREPYRFFGLNPASVLTQLLISYSLRKSSELLLEPLTAILENSPFFEKVHTRESMIKKEKEFGRKSCIDKIYWTTAVPTSAIQMSGGANMKLVSSPHALLGLTVVSAVLSELSFFRDAGKTDDEIMRIYNDTKSRVESRMKGNYFGRTVLDSSPNTVESPIDYYIVNDAKKDTKNYIIEGSQWKWAPEDFDMSKTFKVFTGERGNAPKIIETEKELESYTPSRIIEVPLELRQTFIDDIYKALKDRAGIPAGSAEKLIYDYDKIENIFIPGFKNIYTHIEAPEERPAMDLIWKQVSPIFFKDKAGKKEFWYKPWLPRCVSVDQSITGDVTCISMVHAETKVNRFSSVLSATGLANESPEDVIYVVDFSITIAPMGKRINLEAIKYFIIDLRNKGNIDLVHVSYDQFQSEPLLQSLRAQGFEAERLTVDGNTGPYLYLLGLINRGNLKAGRSLYIKNNLKSLKMATEVKGKAIRPKVEHEDNRPVVVTGSLNWKTSAIGSYAKDATDSIAAAIELHRKYYPTALDVFDLEYIRRLTDETLQKKEAIKSVDNFLNKWGLS